MTVVERLGVLALALQTSHVQIQVAPLRCRSCNVQANGRSASDQLATVRIFDKIAACPRVRLIDFALKELRKLGSRTMRPVRIMRVAKSQSACEQLTMVKFAGSKAGCQPCSANS